MSTLSSDVRMLSYEAYAYLYPLVTTDIGRQQAINLPAGARPGFGPANMFHHLREFPPVDYRAVVRVNFDTLYSSAWLDLTAGPVIVGAPDTQGRYYLLPMLDMWTDVFATPGARTTGTGAQRHVITGPGYAGELPDGLPVIASPTPYVWIIGRIQTNGSDDYEFVHSIQDGLTIEPLRGVSEHKIDPDHDTTTDPLKLVNAMGAEEFFAYATRVLSFCPAHLTDFSILARISQLGIVAGEEFDPSRFSDDQRAELQAGASDALRDMIAAIPTVGTEMNGWTTFSDTIGVYGNKYFVRAVVTLAGLGANPVEDALYPLLVADADGEATVGERDYVLHFDVDQLPPVGAFWSLTMYDEEGFQVPNEIDRFAVGDRDSLIYNDDGSLDIYIQHDNPGPDREPNWLPSQPGPLGAMLRLYAPKPEVLDGRWRPPTVRKAPATG
jgi:hypothetical protein